MTQPKDHYADVVVPDEAFESVARAMHGQEAGPDLWNEEPGWSKEVYRRHARAALTAAAPAIVAANQPKPNDDLRETLDARLRKGLPSPPPHVGGWALPSDRRAVLVDTLAPAVEAFVAAQVAAARAKALHEAWLAVHVGRFDHESRGGAAGGPDDFYNGHLHAERAIEALGVNVRETVHG